MIRKTTSPDSSSSGLAARWGEGENRAGVISPQARTGHGVRKLSKRSEMKYELFVSELSVVLPHLNQCVDLSMKL